MSFRKSSARLSERAAERKFIKLCCHSINQKSLIEGNSGNRKKNRSELLAERKNKLIQTAEFAPDAILVYACTIYLQAYFGSERRMILELFKGWIKWRIDNLRIITEAKIERIYYRFVKGYTELEWREKIQSELAFFLDDAKS